MAGNKFLKYLKNVAREGEAEIGRASTDIGRTTRGILSPINMAAHVATDLGAKATTGIARGMVKKTEKSAANLWTGYRESGGAIMAAGVVGAVYGVGSYEKQTTFAPKTGEISYGGTPAIMNADGVSSTTQAPTLGASGNMVFGLHNARKG